MIGVLPTWTTSSRPPSHHARARTGLEHDLARLTVVQPDDEMMQACAALRARCERDGIGPGQKIHEVGARELGGSSAAMFARE
jgi:hypothetical protein